MGTSSKVSLLTISQRVLLLCIAILLSIVLFVFQGETTGKAPLDNLARSSLNPDTALLNGKPTVFEFYADWCQSCRSMAPTMLEVSKEFKDEVDIVLLNVDNINWRYLIDRYKVTGIPQLNFFDANGELLGNSLGLKSKDQLVKIISDINLNKEFPRNI